MWDRLASYSARKKAYAETLKVAESTVLGGAPDSLSEEVACFVCFAPPLASLCLQELALVEKDLGAQSLGPFSLSMTPLMIRRVFKAQAQALRQLANGPVGRLQGEVEKLKNVFRTIHDVRPGEPGKFPTMLFPTRNMPHQLGAEDPFEKMRSKEEEDRKGAPS